MLRMGKEKGRPPISNIPKMIRLLREARNSFGDSEALLHNKIEHIRIKISPLVDNIFEIIRNELISLKNKLDKITTDCPDPDNCEYIATNKYNAEEKACIHKDFGIRMFYIDEYLPYCPKKYDVK